MTVEYISFELGADQQEKEFADRSYFVFRCMVIFCLQMYGPVMLNRMALEVVFQM
jgi:hypothetical protein